jgi:ADP-heptose:LPS heptosyltransferase
MVRFLAAVMPEAEVVSSPHKRSPVASARAVMAARRRFELGVTLRNAARGKILIRLAARRCLGSRGEGARLLMTVSCPVDRTRHQVHDADSILAAVGLEAADPGWLPEIAAEFRAEGREKLRELDLDHATTVALAPTTARGTDKRWPARNFGELARRLRHQHCEPIIVIGPGEEAVAERVCEAAGSTFPVVGDTVDIAGLAAVLSGVRAVVGNDSGPVHLAAVVGTQVVVIFGPTDPARTGPRGARHRIVESPAGIRAISVDEVAVATLDLVQQRQ